MVGEARRRSVDGIICGHIHHAADRTFDGVHYMNCGDWVESCTAIVETHDGDLRVLHWREGLCPPLDQAATVPQPASAVSGARQPAHIMPSALGSQSEIAGT